MKVLKFVVISLLLLKDGPKVYCFFEPFTFTLGAGTLIYYLINNSNNPTSKFVVNQLIEKSKFLCQKIGLCEGCEDYWIPGNVQSLEFDLKNNVFGQPLAVEIILSALKRHLDKRQQPERSLMLSFHGGPGIGKNFISNKIIEAMFKEKHKSNYVHFFRSAIDFPEKGKVDQYKNIIVETVKKKVMECHRSIFVFDEIEKMPNGILDILSGFVKYGTEGVHDFRRVIFILLSNVGEKSLMAESLKSWQANVAREDMNENRLSKLLATEAFNSDGGLKGTGLVKHYSISHYVPFLPLEQIHIVSCLAREVAKQHQIMSDELISQVLEELEFGPAPMNLYSFAGCKGVAERASVLIEREKLRKRRSQQKSSS